MTKVIISKEGLENLKKELQELKTVKRKEVAARIKRALEQGDLTENAEYAEAKEEQAFLEGKIIEIGNKIKQAEILDKFPKTTNKVGIGSKITVQFDSSNVIYQIVGSSEASPSEGKISNESPAGKAFMGHKIGDTVEVETPGGKMRYEILKIE
jgi:transcription elongation factor GreA